MTDILELAKRVEALDGIRCNERRCLASISWFGHTTDEALGELAKGKGWLVFEGVGWICPTHTSLRAGETK